MEEQGYDAQEVSSETLLTYDGREIVRAHGKAWALKPEIHAQRLAMTLAAQQPQHPYHPPTSCTALIDGQLCGGSLIKASVCPRGALGRYGVAATLTCDVCGHVSAVMRGDS